MKVKSEKGVTLIELLVSIVLVAMIVLSVSYLFTKLYENSYREEKKDVSVNIARTIMEELKQKLRTTEGSIVVYGQQVSIASLRTNPAPGTAALPSPPVIAYPSASDKQYEIAISAMPFDEQTYPITDAKNKSYTFKLGEFFSLIQVEVKQLSMNTSYKVQSYIEIKGD
ncbi:type IV pilus modification PilV family protein [Paenibacillus contaminans]|uniref:type IV pilus modification PilV family protein n=1 Tax=Paenibacillus contaminans TaxID=450362 RepID=UPI001314C050|nr:type II secretion system protein [Paenibacillus contaminans]